MEAISARFALIASLTRYSRWTDAASGIPFAERWAITRSASGKAVKASLADLAPSADDVGSTGTLTAEFVALKAGGALAVAVTRQCTIIIIGR